MENTTLLSLIIDKLIRQIAEMNPRYGRVLNLLKQEYTKSEIFNVIHSD